MKLRNKKTGEIIDIYKGEITLHYNQGRKTIHFKRLEDLEEWEDYEEPKEYWYIDDAGVIQIDQVLCSEINMRKSIGNYFETREEVEKAVEKLKAWKRLKDICNIKLSGINKDIYGKPISVNLMFDKGVQTTYDKAVQNIIDLTLLFGGEE